jgi:hypothetical protein
VIQPRSGARFVETALVMERGCHAVWFRSHLLFRQPFFHWSIDVARAARGFRWSAAWLAMSFRAIRVFRGSSYSVALFLHVVRDGHRFGCSTRPLTWLLRKGRSLLENFPAMNVSRFGDIFLRWRRRHTLALCSSGDPLVHCFAIRHLSVPQGRVS